MQISIVSIAFLLSAIISLAVAVIAWRNRRLNEAPQLTFLLLVICVYALTSALEVAAQGTDSKAFWMRFEYFGIAPIPPLFLAFTIAYTQWLERWVRHMYIFAWILTIATVIPA